MSDHNTSATSRPVLVLDADQPSALSIVRALGRKGLCVHVASAASAPLAGYSRFAIETLRYPDPLREESGFIAWLSERLSQQDLELVIPVTERTLVPILRHRGSLDDSRLAMAPSEALEQVLDKERTIELASSLGIPVPKSLNIGSLNDIEQAEAALGYPMVVKPSRSVGQDSQQRVQLSVSYAHNRTELEARLRHALRFGSVIVQELFRGEGVGIELIADRGTVRFAFQHRRLHEVPLTGGGSSLRVSEAIVPELLAASSRLMEALRWHGVAMVEFKYAPETGSFRLMEINGRFWGSLPLAIAAGANFPVMLHELLTTGKLVRYAPARDGVICRQLARDIDWLEHVLRAHNVPQWVTLPTKQDIVRDTLLILSPRHHFDVQTLGDIRPGLVDLKRIISRQWRRFAGALHERRRLAAERRAARPGGAARKQLASAHSVLFLCYGNINRSALAHAYAEMQFPARFSISSAGFHAESGRPADPPMVKVAGERGVALDTWSSTTLDRALVEKADIILAMEVAHLDRLFTEFPEAKGKAFLLGAPIASRVEEVEIGDPYQKSQATYIGVRDRVLAAIDAWFAHSRTP